MNTTNTTTTTTSDGSPKYVEAPKWPDCAICGIASDRLDYAHNTCSQDCARIAAIVEAIGGFCDQLAVDLAQVEDRR
jgi:hypothetical protein